MKRIFLIFSLYLTTLSQVGNAAIHVINNELEHIEAIPTLEQYETPIIVKEIEHKQPSILASFKTYIFNSIASEVGYVQNLPHPISAFPLASLRENNKFISLVEGIYGDAAATWHKDDYVGQINALYKRNVYNIFPGLYWASRTNINAKANKTKAKRELFEETQGHIALDGVLGCQLIDLDDAHLSINLFASGHIYRSTHSWGFAPALGLGLDGKFTIWQAPHRSVQAFIAAETHAKATLGADWHPMSDFEDLNPLANPMAKRVSSMLATIGYFDEVLGFAIKLGITTSSITSKTFSNEKQTLTAKSFQRTIEPYIGVDIDTSFNFADQPTRVSFRGTPRGLEAKFGFSF
ncbi:hypothetical protein KAU11_11890 [Candidatus Babeliales bacterium]|nr:hypothetical protein [Candidatus Babeliales bacterium]